MLTDPDSEKCEKCSLVRSYYLFGSIWHPLVIFTNLSHISHLQPLADQEAYELGMFTIQNVSY